MNKLIIGIILVLLLVSQAQAVKTVVEKEVIASEYGKLGEWFGWGEVIYKITYSDGSTRYKLEKSKIGQAGIYYVTQKITVPLGGDSSGYTMIPIVFEGISCNIYPGTHENTVDLYWMDGRAHIAQFKQLVPCSEMTSMAAAIPNGALGTKIQTPGTYIIGLTEYTYLTSGAKIETTSSQTTLIVTQSPAPTPTATMPAQTTPAPTATLGSGQCRDSYGNIYSCGTATATKPATTTPPPSPGNGDIKVTSNVEANVYIDNKYVGTTDGTFSITVGGHDVKVSKSGYTTYTSRVTIDYGATTIVEAYLSEVTPSPTTPPPTTTTPGGTATSTSAGTPVPTGTSSVDVTYGAGGGGQLKDGLVEVYRGVDIKFGKEGYYVGDIPHDSVPEARKTIDEMIAGKEQAKSPEFEAVFAIAGLVAVAYLVLRKKE